MELLAVPAPPTGPLAPAALNSLPAGITRAAGAGCKRPRTPQPSPQVSSDSGAAFPEEKGGGRLQPRPTPKGGGRDSQAGGRNAAGPTGSDNGPDRIEGK